MMGRTLEERFENRLKVIKDTVSPSTATGETVHSGQLLRYKNMAGDWFVQGDRVFAKVYAITSIGFGSPDTSDTQLELRQQQSLKSLINRMVESARMGRSFGGHRASFGGQELTPEAYEWIRKNAAILLRYVRKPNDKSKTPPIPDQVTRYVPPSPLHAFVYKALIDGLNDSAAEEAAAQAAQAAQQQEAATKE